MTTRGAVEAQDPGINAPTRRIKLTRDAVVAIEATGADVTYWDEAVPGFGCRVRPSGHKSWVAHFRVGGRRGTQRRITLGTTNKVSNEAARRKARELLAQPALGTDPVKVSKQVALSCTDVIAMVARKYQEFCSRGITPAAYLYRHYRYDGDLLYVGITLDPLARQLVHERRRRAGWMFDICWIVIEPFENRPSDAPAAAHH
jgi:hypothetical protein